MTVLVPRSMMVALASDTGSDPRRISAILPSRTMMVAGPLGEEAASVSRLPTRMIWSWALALAGTIASARVDIVRLSARIIKSLLLSEATFACRRAKLQPQRNAPDAKYPSRREGVAVKDHCAVRFVSKTGFWPVAFNDRKVRFARPCGGSLDHPGYDPKPR